MHITNTIYMHSPNISQQQHTYYYEFKLRNWEILQHMFNIFCSEGDYCVKLTDSLSIWVTPGLIIFLYQRILFIIETNSYTKVMISQRSAQCFTVGVTAGQLCKTQLNRAFCEQHISINPCCAHRESTKARDNKKQASPRFRFQKAITGNLAIITCSDNNHAICTVESWIKFAASLNFQFFSFDIITNTMSWPEEEFIPYAPDAQHYPLTSVSSARVAK